MTGPRDISEAVESLGFETYVINNKDKSTKDCLEHKWVKQYLLSLSFIFSSSTICAFVIVFYSHPFCSTFLFHFCYSCLVWYVAITIPSCPLILFFFNLITLFSIFANACPIILINYLISSLIYLCYSFLFGNPCPLFVTLYFFIKATYLFPPELKYVNGVTPSWCRCYSARRAWPPWPTSWAWWLTQTMTTLITCAVCYPASRWRTSSCSSWPPLCRYLAVIYVYLSFLFSSKIYSKLQASLLAKPINNIHHFPSPKKK